MIPSVHVTNSVNINHSASVVLNRSYWIRNKHVEGGPRPHKVSTKILGFGIFMVGVVVLSIGLIIGIEFPIYVSNKIVKDQCILNKDHMFYEKWYRDSAYVRYNRIYYWQIANAHDFVTGAVPQFVEKGPYIYREKRTRINVQFANNRISYQVMVTQTFDSRATRLECGEICTQYDNVSILNTDFIKTMHINDGLDGYIYNLIPDYITELQTNLTSNHTDIDNIYKYLGCVSDQCKTALENVTSVSKDDVDRISFGAFVSSNNTESKNRLLQSDSFVTSSGYIQSDLIRAIYIQLSEKKDRITDVCFTVSSESTAYWAIRLIQINSSTTLPRTFTSEFNSTENDPTFMRINFTLTCRLNSGVLLLITHMLQFSNWPSLLWSVSVCEGTVKTCVTAQDTFETVLSFFYVVKDYVDVFLLNIAGNSVVSVPRISIIQTRSQHQLATGYKHQIKMFGTSYEYSVEGLLTHHRNLMDAFSTSPAFVVSSCLDGNRDNNMIIREYNGSQIAPEGVYRNPQLHRYADYTTYFPPSKICRACSSPLPSGEIQNVFIGDVFRSLTFKNEGEIEKNNNGLYRYTLSLGSSEDTVPCQLINTTSIHGYPSYTGAPVFHNSRCPNLNQSMTSQSKQHTSHIDVEPRTGRFWEETLKLQRSTILLPEYLGDGYRPRHLNVTYINLHIPLYWVDRRTDIVQSEIDYYEYKIKRLMNASCGGLIGLIVVSLIIMAISIFVGMYSSRKNKVNPIVEEVSVTPRV